jgi:predicted DNA-binding transcriptional regulator YafY
LDRIQTLKLSSEKEADIAGDVSTQSSEFTAQILITSRARLMKERFGLDDVAVDVALQIQSFSRQWIIRSIFASSDSARLLEPADLGLEIAKRAQLILDRYQAH